MASKAVMDAVKARVASWANIGLCPLVDINKVAASPMAAFLELDFPVANEERISVGTPGLFREEGAIRLTVHAPLNDGVDDALVWIDQLRDLFRDKTFDGVETFEASPATFDRNPNSRGFYEVPFVVVYQYDIVR